MMTGNDLRAAIERLWPGNGGQTRAADDLGLKSSRRLRAYLSGEREVPGWLEIEIAELLEAFPTGVRMADPRRTIRVLQQQLERMRSPAESAAMIFGVAFSNARRHIAPDVLAELLQSAAADD